MGSLDRKKCLVLLKNYQVPQHIVIHSLRVAQVGLFTGFHLNTAGEDLDLDLIEEGGLLHDITKMDSVHTGRDHALTGFNLLKSLGYPEVGNVVRQHVWLDRDIKDDPEITEAMLVNYADKRVKHTNIVSLSERFKDLLVRYGTTPERQRIIKDLYDDIREIESLIFSKLDINPAKLDELNALDPIERVSSDTILNFKLKKL
ncbi:MAG: HDIG domain-containing protein [Nitrospiraceae bacterium]|nr:HDIG domain-containing protein [Nitrospiraceae bacterium]